MWVEEVGLIEQDLTQHMDLDWRVQKDSIHGSICRAGAAGGCPARPEATQYVSGFSDWGCCIQEGSIPSSAWVPLAAGGVDT